MTLGDLEDLSNSLDKALVFPLWTETSLWLLWLTLLLLSSLDLLDKLLDGLFDSLFNSLSCFSSSSLDLYNFNNNSLWLLGLLYLLSLLTLWLLLLATDRLCWLNWGNWCCNGLTV